MDLNSASELVQRLNQERGTKPIVEDYRVEQLENGSDYRVIARDRANHQNVRTVAQ